MLFLCVVDCSLTWWHFLIIGKYRIGPCTYSCGQCQLCTHQWWALYQGHSGSLLLAFCPSALVCLLCKFCCLQRLMLKREFGSIGKLLDNGTHRSSNTHLIVENLILGLQQKSGQVSSVWPSGAYPLCYKCRIKHLILYMFSKSLFMLLNSF